MHPGRSRCFISGDRHAQPANFDIQKRARAWGEARLKTVAEFAIGYEQLLDATGQPTGPLPPFASDELQLTRMYRMMSLCRLFDARAINLQRTGLLGTYAPCTGHEATT